MSLLRARKLSEEDLDVRVRWFNDPSVRSQMTFPDLLTLEGTRLWYERNISNETRRDFVFEWDGDAEDHSLAAMAGLTDIHPVHKHAELYIIVRPGLTGKGIGREAVEWLCNYGFHNLDLNRIYLYTRQNNDRARRLYERIGFQPEGILREHLKQHDNFEDRYVHSLLASEWRKLHSDFKTDDSNCA